MQAVLAPKQLLKKVLGNFGASDHHQKLPPCQITIKVIFLEKSELSENIFLV